MLQCGACGIQRPESDFSNAQKKKSVATRKCKNCMLVNQQVETRPLLPTVTTQIHFQAPVPIMTVQQHNELMNSLIVENMALKREREELLSKALQLALPADIKKQVAGFEEEISRLRKENEALRHENDHLRSQISALEESSANQQKQITWQQDQITKLMESFKRENKIALRTLFDEAKKMRLDSDPKIANIISKMKVTVNTAAHQVSKERIKTAVDAVPKEKGHATILSIYQKVYPEAEEEESELDDFYDWT